MTPSSKGMTFLNYPFDKSLPKATLLPHACVPCRRQQSCINLLEAKSQEALTLALSF